MSQLQIRHVCVGYRQKLTENLHYFKRCWERKSSRGITSSLGSEVIFTSVRYWVFICCRSIKHFLFFEMKKINQIEFVLKNQLKEKWFRCITMHVVGSVINCLSDIIVIFRTGHTFIASSMLTFVVFFHLPIGLHSLENLDWIFCKVKRNSK